MEKFETDKPEIRKSEKYKLFPEASIGLWGKDVRENHPDQLNNAIMGRIKHLSSRIDQYLPPYAEHYGIDQSLAINLENSFDELAQLYLDCTKEGYGGTLYPVDKENNNTYSFEVIKEFDLKLEEIHHLIIEAENPLFEEKNSKDIKDEDKKVLHEKGINMLKDALTKIKSLKEKLESKSVLS